eukprot:TRINITY_DN3499_c0_g2_i3.p1 TRINITY_DN3499_c0_g2~~TRINITY_DN3499_c0_g2_i3.p1  ORF type:complete len:418 (+),score=129.75 TRINITY_DN3499_c0_g2_i3:123-1256(+)
MEDGREVIAVTKETNHYVLMDDIIDRLKILQYEDSFCKESGLGPFHRVFFIATPADPGEQFHTFAVLVSWLVGILGVSYDPPDSLSDTTLASQELGNLLSEMGFDIDFHANRLRQGYGPAVCVVLDAILRRIFATRGISLEPPIQPRDDEMMEEDVESDGEDAGDMEGMDYVSDDDGDDALAVEGDGMGRGDGKGGDIAEKMQLVESRTDPTEWKLEVERVAPHLKVRVGVDVKDWRMRIDHVQNYSKAIQDILPTVRGDLGSLAASIESALEKIERREQTMNSTFFGLIGEFQSTKGKMETIEGSLQKNRQEIAYLTEELGNISEELEIVKTKMEKKGQEMTNTSPLVAILVLTISNSSEMFPNSSVKYAISCRFF